MQPEHYGLLGLLGPLAKLTLVLGLDEIYMSLLWVVIQAQNLATVSDRPLGKEKVTEAVQWAMSTLGRDQLLFKATAAVFGCIPARESSPGLDSTAVTEFKGCAMELDVLLVGDLQQETDCSDTENVYLSATEVDMETDV